MDDRRAAPFRLEPWFSERVWGRRDLRPWYGAAVMEGRAEPVGEAWLTGPECVVETGELRGRTLGQVAADGVLGAGVEGEFPLLVKMLFPEEKLSVQVHPDDVQAQAMGQARGKTECWYVLEAQPGAAVALGLKDGVAGEADAAKAVRAAVAAGTLEDLLRWVPVNAGDMVFVDAGTVHAIGPGVVLLETQQTSDVTFRLYDYGRPRELHLEQGLRVMKAKTAAGKVAPRLMDGFVRLIEQRYFVVDRFGLAAGEQLEVEMQGTGCLVGLKGEATVSDGTGEVEMRAGQAVVCGKARVTTTAGASFVRCFAP